MNLEWAIVGGGLHGVHIAARLVGEAAVSPDQIHIVDPAPRLFDRWRTCTELTGMTHLRSPAVHNIDLSPMSLKGFARKQQKQDPTLFAPPYDRPTLELFNAHCDKVVEKYGIADRHLQDRVEAIALGCDHANLTLRSGASIETRNVVLAVGASEQPHWPAWAPRAHARIHHVFAPGFDGWPKEGAERIIVLGGGISASQIALRLADEGHQVHLVASHEIREHQFDSDPGWLGPKYMRGFLRERDLRRRRSIISKARHRGSVPPDVHRALRRAFAQDAIRWYQDEVTGLDPSPDALTLRLASGARLAADRVLLATGFEAKRPGGAMIDELVAAEALPCAECGYPVVDAALRWHPRVYVTGPLAELELGPAARNITGALRAGDRVMAALKKKAS